MGDATVNGDMPQSLTLNHLTSYPVVNDSISTFKSYSVGAKSIDLTNAGYAKFVKPTFPYLERPASYAKPYVAKADEIGDKVLSKVDEKVPIFKSETEEVKNTVTEFVLWPYVLAYQGKQHTFDTYGSEYKKCGGDGYVAGGKALITTSLVLSSEVLHYISSFLQAKKEQAKEVAGDGKEKAQDAKEKTQEKVDEAM